jgi:ribulose-phosphate 3-epimerase
MQELIIAPSILSADFSRLDDEIIALEKSQANWIHIDVMDGVFVPSLSFGLPVIRSIRPLTTLPFDVHLMISNAEQYIEDYAQAGADSITIHCEAVQHLDRALQHIKDCGKKAGVALNPSTSIDFLPWVLDKLDLILIMTVNPGYAAQSYITSQQEKIRKVHSLLEQTGYKDKIMIQVDGGINNQTAILSRQAGANNLVAGSYVFSGDYAEKIKNLRVAL